MTIEVDRSRIIAYQRCPRERYLGYHHLGKGIQRRAKALPLVTGSAFHEGALPLLQNDIEGAVKVAINYLNEAFKGKGVGMDGEEVTDQSILYSAQEQMALTEALLRAWGLERLQEFLQNFEIVEVEKEGRATLSTEEVTLTSYIRHDWEKAEGHCTCGWSTDHSLPVHWEEQWAQHVREGRAPKYTTTQEPSLVLMYRPDAIVREKLSGDLYIVSWKTTSSYGKRSLQQAKTDMQSMSEVFGVEQSGQPHIEGVLYLFAVKGKRMLDEWDQLWKQSTHLIYAWKNVKPKDDMDEMWSWTFKYPKEDGSGNSTLGKGWKKVPVWLEYPGGVQQWIEDLHSRSIFPRHLDPFESVFPQSLPVERRQDEVESWKRQIVAQELGIAEKLAAFNPLMEKEYLDKDWPQYTHSCNSYKGCQFIDICFNGVAAEEGELYQIRTANHPEEGDEDE